MVLGRKNKLYLIDFGISKIFKLRAYFINCRLLELRIIASHKGHEIGRKDDLESLGYLLVYLVKGILP